MLLKAKTTRQLAEIPGMEPSRADIVVAGALIVEQIFAELQLSSLTVSDYALREGILVDSIEKLHLPGGVDYLHNIRENSVLHLAETFHYEKQHSQHVAKLAVKLFNCTKHVHGLGTQELEYLEAAAILHDIGFFISHAQHHRHSYYLIRNSELLGFTENEKEIIANVARYHRKSHPKTKHEAFVHLSNDEQQIIKVLASILRVADGLDRSHMSLIEDITVRFEKRRIVLMLNKRDRRKTELEIWSAGRKKLLMEEIFERPIEFHTAN
jgi:exopolyphosphatase/guanosine-5'-triphosphate,3'-diphosphate pyrophosphatase